MEEDIVEIEDTYIRTTAEPLPVQTELSDTDESLTDEAIDQPAAEVDVMGGRRD